IRLNAMRVCRNPTPFWRLSFAEAASNADLTGRLAHRPSPPSIHKPVRRRSVPGDQPMAPPVLASLLCLCIVFVPMFCLQGVARFLFVPMAEAVMFAMIWSFILSRTLVPTMAKYLLQPHVHHEGRPPPTRNPLVRFQRAFEARFERVRRGY